MTNEDYPTQTEDAPAVTWEERLALAAECGEFSTEDHLKAGKWPSCAVGERFGITREALQTDGSPRHQRISELGIRFMDAVKCNNVKGAARIYLAIRRFKAEW